MFSFFKNKMEFAIIEGENYVHIRILMNRNEIGKISCVIKNKELLIADIHIINKKHRNKGYGSQLIIKVLEYSKKNGIQKIVGNLSQVDIDHKEKLLHFYKKFGFKITLYNEKKGNYFGEIEKILI